MRKKMIALFVAVSIAAAAAACGQETPENGSKQQDAKEESEPEQGDLDGENEVEQQAETLPPENEDSLFAELKNFQFSFCSGAGGWETQMKIDADGSFSGIYYDGELGETGEDYPYGTMYECDFTGKFTEPVKVNEYTYSMQIAEIAYEKEAGTEEISDGMLICYTEPYGLYGAEEILLYTPDAPVTELSEEYKTWMGNSRFIVGTEDAENLSFWGLYNVTEEAGFTSYNIIEGIKQSVEFQAKEAALLENSLEKDALTEAELNEKAGLLYSTWDYALNDVWDVLKQTLDEDAMNALIVEEREWIAMKEQAVAEAGAEVGGGSMQSMIMDMKAAELTKARVYELMELLEKNEK